MEEFTYEDCKCRDYRSHGEEVVYHGEDTARRMRRPSAFSDGGEGLPIQMRASLGSSSGAKLS